MEKKNTHSGMTPLLIQNALVVDPCKNARKKPTFSFPPTGYCFLFPPACRRIPGSSPPPECWSRPASGTCMFTFAIRNPGSGNVAHRCARRRRRRLHAGRHHANTSPACDTSEQVRRQQSPALPVCILPSACISKSRSGRTLADLDALAAPVPSLSPMTATCRRCQRDG